MSTAARPRPARPRPAAERPPLRVVPPPPRNLSRLYAAVLSAVGVALVFLVVAVNALAAGDAVTARRLEEDVEATRRRYDRFVAEVAALEDPRRIERVATEQLGMVPATGVRSLVLHRPLPGERPPAPEVAAGARPDPLKPVLSARR